MKETNSKPATDNIVIVGAGQCGVQAADTLRRRGFSGRIVLVNGEGHLPYQRPPLSKQYLVGDMNMERLALRPEGFFDEQNIELLSDTHATSLDRQGRKLKLSDGRTLSYDKLLLATGTRARQLSVPGSHLDGVYCLRGLADADAIRERLSGSERVVVIGGGFIGLEMAAAARKLGKEVVVLESASRLMPRIMPAELSEYYAQLHRENGVDIRTGVSVTSLNGESSVVSVTCDDVELGADIVVVGIGVEVNDELAANAGLECDNGIVVDEACRTSDPNIFAAGDCTRHFNPIYKCHLRLESVQNATDQARIAAMAMLGEDETYKALPWFWTDQFGVKLQMVGLSEGYDQMVVRGEFGKVPFSVYYLKDGRILASDVFNGAKEFMACRRALPLNERVDVERLKDREAPILEVLGLV